MSLDPTSNGFDYQEWSAFLTKEIARNKARARAWKECARLKGYELSGLESDFKTARREYYILSDGYNLLRTQLEEARAEIEDAQDEIERLTLSMTSEMHFHKKGEGRE